MARVLLVDGVMLRPTCMPSVTRVVLCFAAKIEIMPARPFVPCLKSYLPFI